ncbi:hypothetical protein P280DRAFT_152982 [Massarina eburnea CBS 473.64]|uniref:Uncharacterized protein n=1 Tax=Massarina eburnea CBS 473.64 TaxID=1395130 RepID=A0A6A6RMY1_9PLEO|nr:hypothetical protein P280DRAFT_152982 [Massarina eburnea CBS 473.64]
MENIHSATTAQRKDVKVEMDEVVEGESTTPIHDVTPVNPVKDARVDSPTASPITKPKRRLKRSRRTSSIDQASSPSSRKKARTLPEKKAKRKQPARNGFPTKHYDFFPLPEHQHCKNPNPKKIHSLVRVKTGVPPWKYPIEIAIPGLRGQFREILDDEDLDEFLNEYDKGSAPENLVTENPATEHPVTEQSVKELLVLQSRPPRVLFHPLHSYQLSRPQDVNICNSLQSY